MSNWSTARSSAAMVLFFLTILWCGCAERQTVMRDQVTTEYMLAKAGFQQYKPNYETPKSQALLDALPRGEITTFMANGRPYHAYPDKLTNTIYIGDNTAYQKYEGMAKGKNLCQRVDAPNSAGFWSCFQELQKAGAGPQ
jgi:hypothetical protein